MGWLFPKGGLAICGLPKGGGWLFADFVRVGWLFPKGGWLFADFLRGGWLFPKGGLAICGLPKGGWLFADFLRVGWLFPKGGFCKVPSLGNLHCLDLRSLKMA